MAKAKTKKIPAPAAPVKEPLTFAQIEIRVPAGLGQTQGLSVDALDSMTRARAMNTKVSVDGKPLPCRGFKIDRHGNYVLTVMRQNVQIVEVDAERGPE